MCRNLLDWGQSFMLLKNNILDRDPLTLQHDRHSAAGSARSTDLTVN